MTFQSLYIQRASKYDIQPDLRGLDTTQAMLYDQWHAASVKIDTPDTVAGQLDKKPSRPYFLHGASGEAIKDAWWR